MSRLVFPMLVAGLGLWFVVTGLFWILRNKVVGHLYGAALVKLLGKGMRDKALKLSSVIPKSSPYHVVARGALELRVPNRDPEPRAPTDYRSAVEERPFEERVRDELARLVHQAMKRTERPASSIFAGAAVIGGAAWLANRVAIVSTSVALGAGLVAVAVAGYTALMRRRIHRELMQLAETLEPWVQRDEA